MTQFELIDDYLANRLTEQEKNAFEQKLDGDPELKDEVDFQRQVVKGVQQARVAELKTMMNNIPVSNSGWSTGQITAAAVSAAIVAAGLYFYMQNDVATTPLPDKQNQEVQVPTDNKPVEPAVTKDPEEKSESVAKDATPSKQLKALGKKVIPTTVQKPAINVVNPSDELKEAQDPVPVTVPERSEILPSKLEVTTESKDKKHAFHYQFSQGKLILFGPFDENLYEILEIHGEGHAVFLFYKENYYLLDEKETHVTPLNYIRDAQLLKKLKEYRGR